MKTDTSSSTILVICVGFLIIYLISTWKAALILSLIIGIIGIISPFLSKKIEWVWMELAGLLGYIVPNIILTIVYFLVLLPTSIISKIFKKDTLMLSKKYSSHFIDINKEIDKKSFEKIW